jgi:enterochelin esterase-like enzyme
MTPRSKMMQGACLILMAMAFGMTIQAQVQKASQGSIRHIENFPSRFVQPRNVDIWVPAGYDPKKKYAVLYMHDGQMLYDSTTTWNHQEWGVDETLGDLQTRHTIRDCIVVGIWNTVVNRHAEYFPQKAIDNIPSAYKAELLPLIRNKPQADNYLKFLVTELKPWVDSAYSTAKDQRNTFTAGSSMGGLISLYAVCEYPEVFFGAACLSTHWPGTFDTTNNPIPDAINAYLKAHLPKPANHMFYFDHGTASLDSLYKPFQEKVDAIFQENGYDASNFSSREFPGDSHTERSWNNRFYIPASFLLRVR